VRYAGRAAACAAGVLLLLPVVPWARAPLVLPALSPYLALASAAALRSATLISLLALPMLLLAALKRRWFCRYACPTGLLLELVGLLRPKARKHTPRLPPLGQWIAMVGFGSALIGFPLLLWLDPLVLFNGSAALWSQPFGLAAALAGAGLPLLGLLAVVQPNLWCARLCPLGGTQELIRDAVLAARRRGPQPGRRGIAVARRAVLGAGVGAVTALALPRRARRAVLRPPGAVPGDQFADLCVACGNCIRVCPAKIIEPNLDFTRARGFLTPVLNFEKDYCGEECHACTQVCPTGAIRALTLEEKRRAVIGLAVVDKDRCVLSDESQPQDCAACEMACPFTAIRIVFDEGSYASWVDVDPQKCTGCGACAPQCPANPRSAIVIRPA
jgi:ferredoxin